MNETANQNASLQVQPTPLGGACEPLGPDSAATRRTLPTTMWHSVPLLLLFLGSATTMLQRWNRSLWQDEAWVANSVLAGSWHDMFFYDSSLQTAPPLFLLLVRTFVRQFGVSDWSLKFVPLVFGLAAVVTFALLAKKMFGPRFAFLATIFVAFSPLVLTNSQIVKQYSGELLASCVILLLSWNYLSQPTTSHYWILLGAGCVLAGLSYSLAMVLPVAGMCLLLAETATKVKLWRLAVFDATSGVILACLYWFFVRPNSGPSLYNFWYNYFPHGSFGERLSLYFRAALQDLSVFLIPGGAPLALAKVASMGFAIVALSGFVTGLAGKDNSDPAYRFYLLTFLPLLSVIALNLAGIYPFGGGRTDIFLVPPVGMWLTFSLKALWNLAFPASGALRRLSSKHWIPLSASFAVVLSLANAWGMHHRSLGNWEDVESALRFVHESLSPEDVFYVHASLTEPAKLYFTMWKWRPSQPVMGNTGGPCCPRFTSTASTKLDGQYLVNLVKERNASGRRGRVWVLATGRALHWQLLGRNDFESIDRNLRLNGCSADDSPNFHNVMLRCYQCR